MSESRQNKNALEQKSNFSNTLKDIWPHEMEEDFHEPLSFQLQFWSTMRAILNC